VGAIDKLVPGWSRNAPLDRGQSFDGGPGPVVDGPKTREALRQVQMQGATVHDQLTDAQNKVINEQKENEILLNRKKADDKKTHDDKTAANQRDRNKTYQQDVDSKVSDREAKAKAARDKAAEKAKPTAYKQPTEGAIKDQGAKYTSEHKLPEADAKLAARDHHRLVHDFMQANKGDPEYTREDAVDAADEVIKERIVQPPEPGKRKILGVETPFDAAQTKRPSYDRSKATPDFGKAAAPEAEAKPEAAPGIKPGKNIVETKPDAASVPPNSVITNPDGTKEKAVNGKWVPL
jgi:hypothetical protein